MDCHESCMHSTKKTYVNGFFACIYFGNFAWIIPHKQPGKVFLRGFLSAKSEKFELQFFLNGNKKTDIFLAEPRKHQNLSFSVIFRG